MSAVTQTLDLRRQQQATLLLLFIGYTGYYICRTNLAVATPLIINEFHAQGIDKTAIGNIVSIGTTFYAAGKLLNGMVCDFIGGKWMFVLGMLASVLCTILFGFGSTIGIFGVAWAINRFVQSTGWAALVKTSARWMGHTDYGKAMGFLSLSFLLGNAAVKWVLGMLIEQKVGWRGLFFVCAGMLFCIALLNLIFLKSGPAEMGLPEPEANPANLFGQEGEEARPAGLISLLKPFLTSPIFWTVLVLSFGLTLIRETFGSWTPTFLHEVGQLSMGDSAKYSAFFDLFGGFSVIASGWATDRFFRGRRGEVTVLMLLFSVGAMFLLSRVTSGHPAMMIALLSLVALLTIGPYSFLAGAISLDMGGKSGSAMASGLVDGAGYLSGIIAGAGVASLATHYSWGRSFQMLSMVLCLMVVAAVVYMVQERTRFRLSLSAPG